MKQLLFATTNARKIQEANLSLAPYAITVAPVAVTIDEIQHADSAEIAKAKAKAAYTAIGKPLIVSDTCWEIPALGGFPGGYMKDISAWFKADDWLALMAAHNNKTIYCLEHLAYYDGTTLQHFVEQYEGTFVNEARGRVVDDESVEQVVTLYGGKTMAEYLAAGEIASAGEVHEHWRQFGKWYTNHQ